MPNPQKDSEKAQAKICIFLVYNAFEHGFLPVHYRSGIFSWHAPRTDADHVVAVTTIVSRERTIRSSALIGILWGLGIPSLFLSSGRSLFYLAW